MIEMYTEFRWIYTVILSKKTFYSVKNEQLILTEMNTLFRSFLNAQFHFLYMNSVVLNIIFWYNWTYISDNNEHTITL